MNLSKSQRAELRMKFGGKCAYCGCDLPEKGWHADHVEAVRRQWWKDAAWRKSHAVKYEWEDGRFVGHPAPENELRAGIERPENDTLDNLFPSCRACNIDKHANTLEGWREQMHNRVGVCRRNYSAFRHAERFGLVQEIKKPIVFWYERYAELDNGDVAEFEPSAVQKTEE